MKFHRKLQLLAALIIISGAALLLPFAYFWTQNRVVQAQSKPASQTVTPAPTPAPTPTLIIGKPVALQIPSLGFDLQVVDGAYNANNGTWTLSRDKAHYALPSMQPNNEHGNTLIYGHYRKEVFARLHLIKEGAEASVVTDNGYRFVYVYKSVETTSPADTSVFAYDGAPQLTIQTCTGTWMQNRQLYFFNFDRVEKQ
ncbi:MAG: sortase [Patescibacteria group bacterium]